MKFFLILTITVIALLFFYQFINNKSFNLIPSPSPITAPTVLGAQTKTADCLSRNALPDTACTPGAIFTNPTKTQICTPGYSSSVRNVPVEEKNQVYAEYGIAYHKTGEYEVDHLISLELGGSNDIANLWPEPANPRPGFHEKDQVENYLHQQVCNGSISLQQAQQQISTNWLQVYKNLPDPKQYDYNNFRKK